MVRHVAMLIAVYMLAFGTAAATNELKLVTGPEGGSWYSLGHAIKTVVETALPGITVQVLPGGAVRNVRTLQAGKADLGLANSVSTVDAIFRRQPSNAKNICNLATLYPQYVHIVARADVAISTPADLRGKTLATQAKGSTVELVTAQLLQAYGLLYDQLAEVRFAGYAEAIRLLKDGRVQSLTAASTVPARAIRELAAARPIRFIPVDDRIVARMRERNPGYQRLVIGAKSYPGQAEDVPTIGYVTHLIGRCDLPAKLVRDLVSALAAHRAELATVIRAIRGLDGARMAQDIGVPLHEGAKRFYQEQGVL